MLSMMRPAGPRPLLPSFERVHTPEEWGEDALDADLAAMRAGRYVPSRLYVAIAKWAIEKAYLGLFSPQKATATMQFHSPLPTRSGCMTIAHQCCSRAGLRWTATYINVAIGKDEHGKVVTERLHRLVCWARHGEPAQGEVATHVGHGGHVCEGGKKCVHPNHLEWWSQEHNAHDYANRRGWQNTRNPQL
jgi:hypothetical protein